MNDKIMTYEEAMNLALLAPNLVMALRIASSYMPPGPDKELITRVLVKAVVANADRPDQSGIRTNDR